jgi:DNA-binding transcriptional ArsR family regulator
VHTQEAAGSGDGFDASVALLKALADPTRLRIVWALTSAERSVGQLAQSVGAHVAAVSQHLARLREAGLVDSRRDGTRIFYRLASDHVRALLEEVAVVTGRLSGQAGDEATPAEPAAAVGRVRRREPTVVPARPWPVNG